MLSNPPRTAPAGRLGAKLSTRLDLAAEFARQGPRQSGRELCATLFLEHAMLLSSDAEAKRRFIECLLLLRMENLLLRFLHAVYGCELERRVLTGGGVHRTILAFPAGTSLVIPWSDLANDPAGFATHWAQRILTELDRPYSAASAAGLPSSATRAVELAH